MYLGVIAGDFTGASDTANTLAKGGLATTQFFGLQQGQAPQDCDAGVISLKTRSIDAGEAVDESLRALKWLKAQGCRQFIFKYCSTFDSTPRGNIGPVGEALASELEVCGVPACPAFPTTGRTIYQGHLFVGDPCCSTHQPSPWTADWRVGWRIADVRFGSKADMCVAKRHVRFTPNSDIDCVFWNVCFGPKTDIRGSWVLIATALPGAARSLTVKGCDCHGATLLHVAIARCHGVTVAGY